MTVLAAMEMLLFLVASPVIVEMWARGIIAMVIIGIRYQENRHTLSIHLNSGIGVHCIQCSYFLLSLLIAFSVATFSCHC